SRERDDDSPPVRLVNLPLDQSFLDELLDRAAHPPLVEPKAADQLTHRQRVGASELGKDRTVGLARVATDPFRALGPDVHAGEIEKQPSQMGGCHATLCCDSQLLSIATISAPLGRS